MPRSARKNLDPTLLTPVLGAAASSLSLEEKTAYLASLRANGDADDLDTLLLHHIGKQAETVAEMRRAMERQEQMLKKLTAPPWHPALFLGPVEEADAPRALVITAGRQRVVGYREGFETGDLLPGDEVLLNESGNCIVARSKGQRLGGEMASFARRIADGRLVVRQREEEIIVHPLRHLRDETLAPGDLIRIEREFFLAFEKVERAEGHAWLRDDAPAVTRGDVGGQGECLNRLLRALTATLVDPDRAARYGIRGRKCILLHGPAGCGKTLMARVAVAEVQRLSGRTCKFVAVKPGELISKWYGETENNTRTFFKALREAAERDGFVVAFIDEIESICRIRGGALGTHDDRSLAALLTEIDGFTALGNVALICATNRKDMLDPAALERLGATDVRVPRPNLRATRAIFGIHLPESLPFSPNGSAAPATRVQLIDAAVSRLFDPNADNAVCKVRFRDGKDRTVGARELVSGRLIQQICEEARHAAFHREVESGEAGVQLGDVAGAVESALERLRTTVTIHNAHAWLDDLPQDIGVVAVEPLGRKVKRPRRFLNE